jgi:hypothetical protein
MGSWPAEEHTMTLIGAGEVLNQLLSAGASCSCIGSLELL